MISSKPAAGLVSFLAASPTPFHCVQNAVHKLESAGFSRLNERASWASLIKPGGKYFVTRNQSSIVAFSVPANYKPGSTGFAIVGCHTDSPCFKIRPVSKRSTSVGSYVGVGVETYGGGLWHTWLDRDLGLAGRVIINNDQFKSSKSQLVNISKPILRIPTLAIHLDRSQNEAMKYNTEVDMVAVLGLALQGTESNTPGPDKPGTTSSRHSQQLIDLLAASISAETKTVISAQDIGDFELSLYDVNPPTLGGVNEEFVFSGRLDNLFSSYCAIEALVTSSSSTEVHESSIQCIALWDNEEVGSVSAQGAESNLLVSVISRVTVACGDENPSPAAFYSTIASSFLLSTDMGHAVHPSNNLANKHQSEHRPIMNKGPAIKTNANQRYASNAISTFLLRECARMADVPLQEFEVRNDCACGSTIGPLVSKLGLRTVDIGCAQLSMHSCREQAGAHDVEHLIRLFVSFFKHHAKFDAELVVD